MKSAATREQIERIRTEHLAVLVSPSHRSMELARGIPHTNSLLKVHSIAVPVHLTSTHQERYIQIHRGCNHPLKQNWMLLRQVYFA